MPCYKCTNGKWKYGQEGNCQFDTLGSCEAAERAIHARKRRCTNELQTDEETRKEKTRKDVKNQPPVQLKTGNTHGGFYETTTM